MQTILMVTLETIVESKALYNGESGKDLNWVGCQGINTDAKNYKSNHAIYWDETHSENGLCIVTVDRVANCSKKSE